MEKALIVTSYSQRELDEHLSDGWKVKMMCGMPGASSSEKGSYGNAMIPPTCLVILTDDKNFK